MQALSCMNAVGKIRDQLRIVQDWSVKPSPGRFMMMIMIMIDLLPRDCVVLKSVQISWLYATADA